jgi:hypothetical protein
MIIVYAHSEDERLRKQIKALLEIGGTEEDKKREVDQEAKRRIKSVYPDTARWIEPYKDCMIEDYRFYFEITDPKGNKIEDLFSSMEEAKQHIDKIEPYLQKPVVRPQRIHNVRFVR